MGKGSANADRGRRNRLIFESLEIRNLLAGDLFSAWAADDMVDDGQSAQIVSTTSTAFTALASAEGESTAEGEDAPDLVAFAKALTDAGVKLYSAAWCSFCTAQKQLFQDGGSYLPFIEVTNPDRTRNAIGIANNIESFPTWEFPGGSREEGVLSLQELSQLSGVAIPTSSLPYIKPLPDTTLLSGSPLHVALDGYDPNGGPLTYTVTSDNSLVTPTLLQGNRSMRIQVAGYGDMVFQLFEQRAERPADRVIELASTGFYDGILFHRVIDGFVIQGGDPTGTGSGGSTLGTFDDQFHVDLQHNQAGILSYAKSSDDTNDSQFFVTLGATRHLDFNHSIFGLLVEGKAVLDAIGKTATGTGDRPTFDIRMTTVEIFQDTENAVVMLKADPAAVGQQANITVTVTDNTGNQVQDTFRATVAADTVNGGPFLADLPDFQTTPGTPVQIQLTATDVEGDPVFFDAFERGTVDYQLSVNNTTGLVTVTPPAGYVGPLEVLVGVRALNGSGTTDTWDSQIVKVNVLAGDLTLDLLATSDSNIDNDNVTNVTNMTFRVGNTTSGALVQIRHNGSVIGQGTATGTSIDIATNNLAALGDGTYPLTAVQTIGGVTSDPSNTLNVTLDTTPPVPLTSTPPTTATNGIEVLYDAQHPEEGTPGFGYSLSGAPAGAVIDPVTGVMRWTPTTAQGGANVFQVVAKDLAGNLRTQDLNINVTVVDQEVLIELVVVDAEENPVTTISAGEDFWVFAYVQDIRTPAEGVFAAYADISFNSTIVSSKANSLSDVIFGTKYQNGKSGFFNTPGLIDEIGAFGPITPVGGGKELLFALPFRAEQAGEVTIRLDPSDTVGREVLVFGQNEPVAWNAITLTNATLTVSAGLTAVSDLFNVDEDSVNFPLNVLANDVNEMGGTVTITQVGTTSHGGTVTIGTNGQNLLYSPAANFFGEETFTYTITNNGLTSTGSVTVQVAPVNDAPTAVSDTFTVDKDSQSNFLDVLANDLITPDTNETLRIVSVGSTSHGGTVTIAPNGTHLLYTPPAGFSGNETFSYTIRDRAAGDASGLQSTASVMMTVETVARPTARPDTATVQEDSTANAVQVLANDDPVVTGGTLRVVLVTQSKFGGTVTIAGGGTHVLYTPAANFFGEDTFTYTVEEVDGERATASVTMTVQNVNDPPTANDDTYQVSKGSATKTLNVLENDSILPDANEVLTITAVTQGSQGGTVAIATGGQAILYTPSANTSLPDTYTETFTYTVGDGSGETDTATVTIQIRPYTARDIGGMVMHSASTRGIGGMAVNLQGVDDFNGPIVLASQTLGNGAYMFADLAPGSYQLKTNAEPFLVQSNTVLTVVSGDGDGSSLNNNFNSIARDPATLSIADFLARAPGRSAISPSNSVLVAAQAGSPQSWYSFQSGWQDYTQLQAHLSSDASQLTLTAIHSNGQQYQGTVALNASSYVKRLANSGGAHLVRIDAGPTQLGMQPVANVPVVTVTPKVTKSTTPTITGTVSSGTLQVVVNNRTYSPGDGNLTVTGTNWSLAIPTAHALPQGTYNVSAKATGSAGQVGNDATANELVVDTAPPTVTVTTLTTADTTPNITGTVSDGALQVAVNNRTYTVGDGNLTVSGTTWTLAIPAAHALAAGTYNVTASATDAAGNTGSDTTNNELVVDLSVPTVTVTPLTTKDNTPIVTGTVSAGTLQVVVNGRTYAVGGGALTVNGTAWTLQIPAADQLADGTYSVTASATNSAGTVGTDTTANELVIDTVPPTVTVTSKITADTTPTIAGTVSDGTLTVVVNSRTYTAGDGNLTVTGTAWSLTIPAAHALTAGTYSVTASATDAAGNTGSDTTTNELVIDTSVPVVTVNSLRTKDTTPTITGTVSAGALQVTVNSQAYTVGDGNLTVSGTAWTLQIPAARALAEGTYSVTASATNQAGSTGTDSTSNELVVDTTAPVVTVNSLSTADTTPAIAGTVSDGIMQVVVNGRTYTVGDGNLSVTGTNWALQIPAQHALTAGTYTVTASSTDLAGNVGTSAGTGQLVIQAAAGEGEAYDDVWANADFLDEIGHLSPTVSADAYAQAVDALLAEQAA